MDYTTQGNPNQVTPPVYIKMAQATAQNQFFRTNNFSIPDGSNRHIHEIRDMLHTSKFLMDEMSGQFYTVYGNTYQ